ncbi:uncharacterized protein CLUP02_07322 [Colletotrichum lupini]|uniref:Uncharacterized protein n=1 Tax=Colletotrichum lupini TaxID=145971 RepID=A0A9Q8SS48_9PEZI|nr:uncharacterized protein CLUP02_07322 [Colletotrichum lupini]UQC81836.1 hypothetical protein CLUP02_07322 [Colletotrichum lupini]
MLISQGDSDLHSLLLSEDSSLCSIGCDGISDRKFEPYLQDKGQVEQVTETAARKKIYFLPLRNKRLRALHLRYWFGLMFMAGRGYAHMAMTDQPPIKAKGNPNTSPENANYSYTPHYPQAAAPVNNWTAGNSYSVTISGHAVHAGGLCQTSLSLDGGNSLKVLRSFISGCPRGDATQLGFRLPGDTPS